MKNQTLRQFFSQKKGILKSRIIYDFNPIKWGRLSKFYTQFIQPGDVCFDLGAHTGNHSSAWLKLGAKVIALEPQPQFIKILKRKMGLNPNFILKPMGAASKPGTITFHISSNSPTVSTFSAEWKSTIQAMEENLKWDKNIEVEVTTLDSLIAEYGLPKFCKIDVEGYEEEVFKGLTVALPLLSFEFFPTTPERSIACIEKVKSMGIYVFNWSLRETYHFIEKDWCSAETMISIISDYRQIKSGDIYAQLIST